MTSSADNSAVTPLDGAGDFLAVDFGNTYLKATLLRGNDAETGLFSPDDTDSLLAWLETHPADCGAMVSVRHTDARLVETLRQALHGEFLLVTHHTPLPVKVSYDTPASLGLDRLVAVCGAKALFPGRDCVVVDAGTAMTIDSLMAGKSSEEDRFAGGSISPGLRMRLQAMHEYTDRLPLIVPPYGKCPQRWACSTGDALLAGALGGMADQVLCSRMRPDDAETLIVLTGGDADVLEEAIAGRADDDTLQRVRVVTDLVARGLQLIYMI